MKLWQVFVRLLIAFIGYGLVVKSGVLSDDFVYGMLAMAVLMALGWFTDAVVACLHEDELDVK